MILARWILALLLPLGLPFVGTRAYAQQDPLLGLHNCMAYYPQQEWFKRCAPFCWGIYNNTGHMPSECHSLINGPRKVTPSRTISAAQREREILKTQQEIRELQNDISEKTGVSVALIVASAAAAASGLELPLWLECAEKTHSGIEAYEISRLWKKLQYDTNTYLPQQWGYLNQDHPRAYNTFLNDYRVRTFKQRQVQLQSQGRNQPASCNLRKKTQVPNDNSWRCKTFETQANEIQPGGWKGKQELLCMYHRCLAYHGNTPPGGYDGC